MQINLILSLVFGVGQVVVGLLVARRLLTGGAWRRPNLLALLLVCCWFVASGICELFVSGMESARSLVGTPTLATFDVWRARADDTLLGVSVALVVFFVAYALVSRMRGTVARR